jgi:hypothetical protein
MITNIDRQFLQTVRPELETALADVAARYGVKISLGNCTFSSGAATFKLNIATKTESGDVMTPDAEMFKLSAYQFGLKPENLFAEFTYGGERYKLTGLKPRSRFPIIAQRLSNGKSFKLPIESVMGKFA